MTKKQKDEKIIEFFITVIAIISVRIIFVLMLYLTPLANYIGVKYENQYYNKNIYTEGKISGYILEETQKALDNIPKSLISLFYENGGMVNVTNEKHESAYTYENDVIKFEVAGFYRHKSNEIYIMNYIDSIQYGTVEHEFGHYLDFLFDVISEKQLFTTIYLEEYHNFKEHIKSDNYYDNNKEYFAESFSTYTTNPKKLKKYCPKTYLFLVFLIDQVEFSLYY